MTSHDVVDDVVVLPGLLDEETCEAIVAALGRIDVPDHDEGGARLDVRPPDLAVAAARRAFALAGPKTNATVPCDAPLVAQVVVYGPRGRMFPHLDASVGRRPKPLAILSFGAACDFRAGSRLLDVRCGDALVFDAAAVLHGVQAIKRATSTIKGLREARLSMMFWPVPEKLPSHEHPDVCVGDLFLLEEDDDDA